MNIKGFDKEDVNQKVDDEGRRRTFSMFMVMMGFTFCSTSMWTGQALADGLNFSGFLTALILGGILLSAYTGALGYIGADSGMTLDMLSRRAFGNIGSWIPSAMISLTQIGWFGIGVSLFAIPVTRELFHYRVTSDFMPLIGYAIVIISGAIMTASAYKGIRVMAILSYIAVPLIAILGTIAVYLAMRNGDSSIIQQFSKGTKEMSIYSGMGLVIGSFVSGGTTTPNFTRFVKSSRNGALITIAAFFFGNGLMIVFGALSSIYAGGNDIFDVMVNLGLFYMATIVLGLNIWTTNDNSLYTSGIGLAYILHFRRKTMVLLSGAIGTLLSIWLYWNFKTWLNMLSCTLPPIGIIIILDYFINRHKYTDHKYRIPLFDIYSMTGILLGAIVANIVTFGIPSINGIAIASACYMMRFVIKDKNDKKEIYKRRIRESLTRKFD